MDRREFVRWLLALLAGLGLKWPGRAAATSTASSRPSDCLKFGGAQDRCVVRIPGRPDPILGEHFTVQIPVERSHDRMLTTGKLCTVIFGHMIGPCDAMTEFFSSYGRVENAAVNDLIVEGSDSKWQLTLKGVVIASIALGVKADDLYVAEGVTLICVSVNGTAVDAVV